MPVAHNVYGENELGKSWTWNPKYEHDKGMPLCFRRLMLVNRAKDHFLSFDFCASQSNLVGRSNN